MDQFPHPPRQNTAQFEPAHIDDRKAAADRAQIALMPVTERSEAFCPLKRWRISRATYCPPALQPAREPGTACRHIPFRGCVSPITKMSGCPGTVRSGPTTTRPARSASAFSQRARARPERLLPTKSFQRE